MSKRPDARAMVVLLIVLTAGCGTTAHPTDEPRRNATLSLSGYEPTADVSSVGTRAFWDRSSNWEDPRVRNVTVTSRTYTYRNLSGTDAVVVVGDADRRTVGRVLDGVTLNRGIAAAD